MPATRPTSKTASPARAATRGSRRPLAAIAVALGVAVLGVAPPASAQTSALPSASAPAAQPEAQPAPAAPAATPASAGTATASEPPGDPVLHGGLLLGTAALSLALGPTSVALLNDDLSFGRAVEVSLVGSLGVVCAAGGTVMFVAGTAFLVVSPILALLSDDAAAPLALAGVLLAGVGAGLFFLSPLVFSAAAEVDGGFGDSTGEIAAVSVVSALGAGVAALLTTLLVIDWNASAWLKVAAIFSVSFLAANLAYGLTRAAMFDAEPSPTATTGMLLPALSW